MSKIIAFLSCWVLFIIGTAIACLLKPVALDKFCNSIYFGGDPRESVSSHTGRWLVSGQPVPFKFRLVRWWCEDVLRITNHCTDAIDSNFKDAPL